MSNNKKFVVEAEFINTANKLNLSLTEFLLLIYFENSDNYILDFDLISSKLKIEKEKIMVAFNSLLTKKIIKMTSEKDDTGRIFDKVSLENFYNDVKENIKEEEKGKLKEDIFTKFESEFRRPLSGIEFEIIKVWIEKMYSEELILAALSEAVYNGATNIRYIDTILHEWDKKGFKTKEDVDNYFKNRYDTKKIEETNIFDFNWLDDNEK